MGTPTYTDPAEQHPTWEQLLKDAVQQPGTISKAYSAFHAYSLGNQLAALSQCQRRAIPPGPIHTYVGWHALRRQVRK